MNESVQVKFDGALRDEDRALFPADFQQKLSDLVSKFAESRESLLQQRMLRQVRYDSGSVPGFISAHPAHLPDWRVAQIPEDCQDRRVEITGPVNDRKMVINMLSETADGSIADMAMLDFEDSMCPTWRNVLDGYHNVIGAAHRDLFLKTEKKNYLLNPDKMAHMMVRVRGLHMTEPAVTHNGQSVAASILDLWTCAYHTAKIQIQKSQTPIFYIPKIEHFEEARWWNSLISEIESLLQLERGVLRTTVLIETLPASFQIEEILYEMRCRILGLNGGRWDKIFSDIKILKNHADRVMGDRAGINMQCEWMSNYQKRIVKLCHRRGAFALGGMAAFTPGRDPKIREQQTEKVRVDKKLESDIGCDGCWVSHPYFISVARAQFNKKNQLDVLLEDFSEHADLLPRPKELPTLQGLRTNIRVGIAYMKGWNDGIGCVAFDGLMEDLATLEISRAQVWQWKRHKVRLQSGELVTDRLISSVFAEELNKIIAENLNRQDREKYTTASVDAEKLFLNPQLTEFLTVTEKNINQTNNQEVCYA